MFDGRREFDIVQCHFGAVGLKALLLRRAGAIRGAIVTALHGEDIVNYPKRFRGNIYQPLFADGDLFLPISSRWNGELTAQGCPPDRIRVHRMGIDPERFPAPPRVARQPSGGTLRVLTVGRLVEKKGVGYAIRAVAACAAKCEFVIAGDGPLRASLESLVRELGLADRIRFTGESTQKQVARPAPVGRCVPGAERDGERRRHRRDSSLDHGSNGGRTSRHQHLAQRYPGACGRRRFRNAHSGTRRGRPSPAVSTRSGGDAGLRARMGAAGRAIVCEEFNIHRLNRRLESHYRELVDS